MGGVEVSPRDVVAAVLPDPATIGPRMTGKTCAGLWVTGTGKDGQAREVYLHHVVDNEWSMREYGAQCVVWQTAVNPVVALELLATGAWSGTGVKGPEAFDAVPFLDLLKAPAPKGYASPWVCRSGEPDGCRRGPDLGPRLRNVTGGPARPWPAAPGAARRRVVVVAQPGRPEDVDEDVPAPASRSGTRGSVPRSATSCASGPPRGPSGPRRVSSPSGHAFMLRPWSVPWNRPATGIRRLPRIGA